MTETELRDAYGMSRHDPRTYEGGTGCSCGKEYGHCIRAGLSCLDEVLPTPRRRSWELGPIDFGGRALDAGTGL